MGELKAALEEHLAQIPEAELVAESPTDHEEDHIGGELEEVEGCSGPLVEFSFAGATPKGAVSKDRFLLELAC